MAGYRSYTGDEYRKAGPDAGPFALESNPNHNYRTSRRKPVLGGVLHITVGASDWDLPDTSAEGTTRYGMTTTAQASWHVCIDSDGIIPSIRDSYVAWHAGVQDIPGVNDATFGMEIGTGDTNWNRKPADWVDRTIRLAAIWWAPRVIEYNIPRRLENSRNVIADAIANGRKFGFTSHKIIAPQNRTDPGWVGTVDTFPWEKFFTYLGQEIDLLTGDIRDMEFTDTVPGSNPPATVGQALLRGLKAYEYVIEGGATDKRLDAVEAGLAAVPAVVDQKIEDGAVKVTVDVQYPQP